MADPVITESADFDPDPVSSGAQTVYQIHASIPATGGPRTYRLLATASTDALTTWQYRSKFTSDPDFGAWSAESSAPLAGTATWVYIGAGGGEYEVQLRLRGNVPSETPYPVSLTFVDEGSTVLSELDPSFTVGDEVPPPPPSFVPSAVLV